MAFINFKEIPEAHISSGLQDTFELFARDFLVDVLKFEIISEPSRGADGGKDLLVREKQLGTLSNTEKTWLVSCKHKAHSGSSVSTTDENNITDRLMEYKANGFIGFYSTLPSSGLNNRLDAARHSYAIEIFDSSKIEDYIIKNKRFELFKRYFPSSYSRWNEIEGKHLPTKLTSLYQPLRCEVCGTDLLSVKKSPNYNHGIIGFVRSMSGDDDQYIDCYVACTGDCDRKISAHQRSLGNFTDWDSLSDLLMPTYYLQKYMAILNLLYEGDFNFSEEAFTKYKHILISIGQMVFRYQSEEDLSRAEKLDEIPF